MPAPHNISLANFPLQSEEIVRFSDNDMVGHVNNLAFVSYIETGRVEFLYTGIIDELTPNANFVVVKMDLEFHKEMNWPGKIQIGSAITRIGRTSIGMSQALFQNGICTCTCDSALVLMDRTSRKPIPIPDDVIAIFNQNLLISGK
ncbi:MAG: acyl-CoA thioesterase [Methyloligellaceae bacterium]